MPCETCHGRRYNRETLEVRFKGKSIADVLEMSVEEALEFFAKIPKIRRRLQTLHDVGLDYIRLGQPATTLSGGEAQRVKLAAELSKVATGRTLYILDEPTTGLHFADIEKLLEVLQRLVDTGNTVLVIEHNLDVIKQADWVVDLGPEGGEAGGELIAAGTPEDVAAVEESYTGQFLRGRARRPGGGRRVAQTGSSIRREGRRDRVESLARTQAVQERASGQVALLAEPGCRLRRRWHTSRTSRRHLRSRRGRHSLGALEPRPGAELDECRSCLVEQCRSLVGAAYGDEPLGVLQPYAGSREDIRQLARRRAASASLGVSRLTLQRGKTRPVPGAHRSPRQRPLPRGRSASIMARSSSIRRSSRRAKAVSNASTRPP